MASPIEATLILCDAAIADPFGKLNMLGAGWSVTSSPTALSAVAIMIKVPWDRANQKMPLSLTLIDADGSPVQLPDNPTEITHTFEVGRPPGIDQGSSIDASFAVPVPPLPLPPGRYQWRLLIADEHFAVGFQVRGAM